MVEDLAVGVYSIKGDFVIFDIKQAEMIEFFRVSMAGADRNIIERPATAAGGDVSYEVAAAVRWCYRTKAFILVRVPGYHKIGTGFGKDAEYLRLALV
jgi:hypothetical protein